MLIKTTADMNGATGQAKYIVEAMYKKGYKTVMICDSELYASLEFIYACKKKDINPIIAQEKTVENVKFLLVAKNMAGFNELNHLSGIENPVFKDLIFKNVEVVISFDNENFNKMKEAKEILNIRYSGIRKVENPTLSFKIKEKQIKALGLKEIPYEISLYYEKEDLKLPKLMKAIIVKDEKYLSNSYNEELDDQIKEKNFWNDKYPEETKNLIELISECKNDYKFGNPVPPNFIFCESVAEKLGFDKDQKTLFAQIARAGLEDRLLNVDPSKHQLYRDRLEFEIDIIQKMNFDGYLLIVWDFVNKAKELDIPVGPGRGSAAGSLAIYCLKITDIDPIPYGLLFERFLNPDRVSMPDIDMDFCQTRRGEVLSFVREQYGEENVAQIITFLGLKSKSVLKDVGRVLSTSTGETLAALVPEDEIGITLEQSYEMNKDIEVLINENSSAKEVWNLSKKIENNYKSLGVHAAGVVISDEKITNRAPVKFVGESRVVQFEGKYLEDVNLIKFDFLGLKTLSVIKEALTFIKKNKGIDITLNTLNVNIPEVYKFISSGLTNGLFQIESSGMKNLCTRLQPDCFEDLIAILALYRPGPLESGMVDDFIERKRGRREINYFFDEMTEALEPILKPTYGVIVYQEQVMQIVQEIGGFSLGGADLVRRAMGKKIKEEMDKLKGEFADGAEKKGYKRENAEELFELIVKFAGYGFNKSHSAAYAMITYYTAYLKTFYKEEFMAALMNFAYDKHEKLIPMIKEAEHLGIPIEYPSLKNSNELFSTDGKTIFYGLKAISGVGKDVEPLLSFLKENSFEDLKDFLFKTRITLNIGKKILEGLSYSGALDHIASRGFFHRNIGKIMKIKNIKQFDKNIEEILSDSQNGEELPISKRIELEIETIGFIKSNPFIENKLLDKFEIDSFATTMMGNNRIVGLISEVSKTKTSKKGKKFNVIKVMDINMEEKEILNFNEVDIELPKIPCVIEFSTKEGGALFFSGIKELNFNNLNSNFVAKKEEVKIEKNIELRDFESLINLNENVKVLNITKDGKTLFSLS